MEEFTDKNDDTLMLGFYAIGGIGIPMEFTGEYENEKAKFRGLNGDEHLLDQERARQYVFIQDPKKYATELSLAGKLLEERALELVEKILVEPSLYEIGHGPFGKHPYLKDGGYVHPHKKH